MGADRTDAIVEAFTAAQFALQYLHHIVKVVRQVAPVTGRREPVEDALAGDDVLQHLIGPSGELLIVFLDGRINGVRHLKPVHPAILVLRNGWHLALLL